MSSTEVKGIPAGVGVAMAGGSGSALPPEDYFELPPKATKPGRFLISQYPFYKSAGSAHPHTSRISKVSDEGKKSDELKQYLLFLSASFARPPEMKDAHSEKKNDSHYFLGSSASSETPKTLPEDHPALQLTLCKSAEGVKKDVDRAVLFSQLASMLLAGSPVDVADVRKVTPAIYRTKVIPGLTTNINLNGFKSVVGFIRRGGVDFLEVHKILRNNDARDMNAGLAEERFVCFDFDQFGTLDLVDSFKKPQGSYWGFSSRGADRPGWVPPLEVKKYGEGLTYVYGKGPYRWVDRQEVSFIEVSPEKPPLPKDDLKEGSLEKAPLPEGDLKEGSLEKAPLPEGDLKEGSPEKAPLPEGDLKEGSLEKAPLPEGDLKEGSLEKAPLPEGDLKKGKVVAVRAPKEIRKTVFSQSHHHNQLFWRRLYCHRDAIHIQHFLYFKFLLVKSDWLENIVRVFVGEYPFAQTLYARVGKMREDVWGTLLSSAVFRLDFLMNHNKYETSLRHDFSEYNRVRWPNDEKPLHLACRVVFDEKKFACFQQLFLFPSLEKHARHYKNPDQTFAYLQFLVLLSSLHPKALERLSEESSFFKTHSDFLPGLLSERTEKVKTWGESLPPAYQQKLRVLMYLFSRFTPETTPATYGDLFFLCKAFDFLYSTVQRSDEPKPLFNIGFSRLRLPPDELSEPSLDLYFPKVVYWAFSNFSVEALSSETAEIKFPESFADSICLVEKLERKPS